MAGTSNVPFLDRIESLSLKEKYVIHELSPHALIYPTLSQFFDASSGCVVSRKIDVSEHTDEETEDASLLQEEWSADKSKTFVNELKRRVVLGSGSVSNVWRPVLHGSVPICHQRDEQVVTALQLTAVGLDEARLVLSEYIQAVSTEQAEQEHTMTVLCDGSPPTNTVAISASAKGRKVDFDEVTFSGHVGHDDCYLENLTDRFSQAAAHCVGHTTPLQICSKAYARYDVLTLDTDSQVTSDSHTLSMSAVEEDISSCRLSVEWVWKDVSSVLCEPSASAQGVLNAKVVPGDDRSPLAHVYQELLTLKVFLQTTAEPDKWAGTGPERSRSFSGIIEELAQEMEDLSDGGVASGSANEAVNPLAYLVMPERGDMDCTERLWKAVKDARSISYLQGLFSAVFNAIVSGVFQPYIFQHNKTSTAAILRECLSFRGQVDNQQGLIDKLNVWFTPKNILECCVEMGLNKLRRDYEAFFLGEELTTLHHLGHFLEDKPTLSLQQKVSTIESLHCVAEVITTVKLYMAPPPDLQRAFVRHLLGYYSAHPASSTPLFSLPLVSAPPQLRALCQRLHPSMWVVSFEATNVDVQHLHVFSTKELFTTPTSSKPEVSTANENTGIWISNMICTDKMTIVAMSWI